MQVPQGFFVYSTIKSYIIGCCIAPANIGFDSSIDIPFYGFAPNGGVVDFSNSSFDFTGGSMVFPTVNTSLKTMPIYEISFSQNEENKSTLEDMSSVEVLFGGEKFFVNNMKGVENVQIPSSALKESFSYVNLKDGKSEIDSIILKLGKQNKNEKEILVPIITDPGLILNYPSDVWRTVDYEIFEWDRFDRILFFDTKDYDVQNRFFRRLAFFVEKTRNAPPQTPDELTLWEVAPAYIISELKTAFTIGFVVYLPFLVIDIVVSSVLVSMGMMFLPPTMIALPFKLIMFVMVDGWYLIVRSLVESFIK